MICELTPDPSLTETANHIYTTDSTERGECNDTARLEIINCIYGYEFLPKRYAKIRLKLKTYFWEKVRDRKLFGLKINRQVIIQCPVDNHFTKYYIADFHCSSHKMIVELDGKIHRKQIESDLLSVCSFLTSLFGKAFELIRKNHSLEERAGGEFLKGRKKSWVRAAGKPSGSFFLDKA